MSNDRTPDENFGFGNLPEVMDQLLKERGWQILGFPKEQGKWEAPEARKARAEFFMCLTSLPEDKRPWGDSQTSR